LEQKHSKKHDVKQSSTRNSNTIKSFILRTEFGKKNAKQTNTDIGDNCVIRPVEKMFDTGNGKLLFYSNDSIQLVLLKLNDKKFLKSLFEFSLLSQFCQVF